jgi:hypothetical protein
MIDPVVFWALVLNVAQLSVILLLLLALSVRRKTR